MSSIGERCSDYSRAADEPLAATASTGDQLLLIEVPGAWGRDVTTAGTLPAPADEAVKYWLARTPRSRLLLIRRPGSSAGHSVAFVVRAEETAADVRRIELARHEDLADTDLDVAGEAVPRSLVLVCGHGSRDGCCALRGTAVYRALAGDVPEDELWLSSHQGGHRFAANVLVLPAGLQLGRLDPANAVSVTTHAVAGRIDLDHYRGRTCYDAQVQAAEHVVRRALALDDVEDLRLVDVDGPVVRFRGRDGSEHAATVEEIAGPVVPASCGAEPEAQRALAARLMF